jgi:hypothetical protein
MKCHKITGNDLTFFLFTQCFVLTLLIICVVNLASDRYIWYDAPTCKITGYELVCKDLSRAATESTCMYSDIIYLATNDTGCDQAYLTDAHPTLITSRDSLQKAMYNIGERKRCWWSSDCVTFSFFPMDTEMRFLYELMWGIMAMLMSIVLIVNTYFVYYTGRLLYLERCAADAAD